MQRKALLIGACVLSTTHAHGSSVTLYGIVDSYVEFDRIGSLSSFRQSGGGGSTSRIGLTGVEDLGGGTSTKFVLESGFSPADGSFQGGTLFYRQAYVALQDTRYGDLRLGRQYTPAFYIVYDGDPFGLNERMSPLALLATSTDTITTNTTPPIARFNQAASYLGPDWNGLRMMATYGFPTPNALSTQAGRNYGAGLSTGSAAFMSARVFRATYRPATSRPSSNRRPPTITCSAPITRSHGSSCTAHSSTAPARRTACPRSRRRASVRRSTSARSTVCWCRSCAAT